MIKFFLDFESEIAQIEGRINELRHASSGKSVSILKEITELEFKANKMLKEKYSTLTPWQRVQVARHPDRPHSTDYIDNCFSDFISLSGDRKYGEDSAIIGGLASFDSIPVMVIAQEKGSDTQSRLKRNFGMAKPEGYRKSIRLMKLADRFNLPIVTFIDTAGAYPGIGAEKRGQSEAIASSIKTCLNVRVPLISVIIGEGGSGGAVALASADKILMLENAIYSVISPEGCASILWKVEGYDEKAANSLKITSEDLKKFQVIDQIIKEPLGGAHRNPNEVFTNLKKELSKSIILLKKKSKNSLAKERKLKYLKFGSNFSL